MSYPKKQGLYDPRFEHDSCGVGFIAHVKGHKSHDMVRHGLKILENLAHRGACGCDPETGDGAGILIQMPDAFFRKELARNDITLPAFGDYGAGLVFLPTSLVDRNIIEEWTEHIIHEEGQKFIGWREVPHQPNRVGRVARSAMPAFKQLFIARGKNTLREDFDRKLYVIRKRLWNKVYNSTLSQKNFYYFCSLNSHTLVYKGQLMSEQVDLFFPDLSDATMVSAIALVHSRYSTNTFPSWALAHPYRYVAHNGEINTLRGNINWIQTREKQFVSKAFGADLKKVLPIVVPDGSDTATFDNVLEMLVLCGRPLPHAMMMMIPEAWSNHQGMEASKRAFYEYHSCLMEPWDGPAAIAFSDGRYIGALLDRNGLRPSRYVVTRDDIVIMASEAGVLPLLEEKIITKGRLQPGKMFLVDTQEGRIIDDKEIKESYASRQPYEKWLRENIVDLRKLPDPQKVHGLDEKTLLARQRAFGYTIEDLKIILQPMAQGEEATGSMGTDTPLAVLSDRPKLLFEYFKQLFAQVTNPPIDAIREEIIMAEDMMLGPESNLLEEGPQHCHRLWIQHPVLTNEELEKVAHVNKGPLKALRLPCVFKKDDGPKGIEKAFEALCRAADDAIAEGYSILILSDRDISAKNVPIPSLLACAGLHHHLIRQGTRTKVSMVVECGEARELHHFAVLIGYGANAVNPYLAFETIQAMINDHQFDESVTFKEAQKNFLKACHKGLYKIISKMGISTIQSYCGAQIFEAVGLGQELIDKYFSATPSRIGGINIDIVALEALKRHEVGYPLYPTQDGMLEEGGEYYWRKQAEFHQLNPTTIALLQHATRSGDFKVFKQYSKAVNEASQQIANIRGLLKFKTGRPIPIDEVEPASSIVKRFATGAMSYGSISKEAHETLAIAMNRLGGFSNTGEGGEDAERFKKDPNGDWRRSRIKQVAQGRFGVTIEYLVNADQLQIKMAQGAKPGEGGQLPGHKVSKEIAATRYTTPGVVLISPPPHHDIYSIEDLAQLIHDLKNANPQAMISVKLVAEIGVGTIAAGVSKGKADHVLISGYEGGTGASPQTSIKHAGLPMELGIAETQQVLVMNDLRGRIRVQTDGQLKTGRDVVIAAMLGADEFGFSTTALITVGCILLRKCHLNTCSVGVATQDKELRKKFEGRPEHVVNFFTFIAEEARLIMAELGFRKFEDLVGRVDMLDTKETIDHWKTKGVDLTNILHRPDVPKEVAIRHTSTQDHGLEKALDNTLIAQCQQAILQKTPVKVESEIRNVNRTVGTMLSSLVALKYGLSGLPENTIQIKLNGSAGQSFGAFLAQGISLTLEGEANDYVGKGLSGGRIVIFPSGKAQYRPEDNMIVGNVVLYGAICGEAFFRGLAGERFAVRNSGAHAVVEGVGDNGCEYMTGGRVVIIGPTGRNFAAGMSGGIAYVHDPQGNLKKNCNSGMVDLFPVKEQKDILELKILIEKHFKYTQSTVAEGILKDWDRLLEQFVKVYPRDYRRVLEEAEAIKNASPTSIEAADNMGDIKGFMKHDRQDYKKDPVPQRIKSFKEFTHLPAEKELKSQGARCMDCGVPFCQSGCPIGNIIPDWNDLVYRDRGQEALERLHKTNNFPEFTGRICPAPCENACVLGINAPPVTIKNIELSIIENAYSKGWVKAIVPPHRTGMKVAVIGSGPAGLACADQLNQKGHKVTVYEKNDLIGGLLTLGIPDFKLEKWVVARRVERMQEEGVHFKTGVHVGVDISPQELREKFDAVVLCGGAEAGRELAVPGRELEGVHQAMYYLPQQNLRNNNYGVDKFMAKYVESIAQVKPASMKEASAQGKHVVILGGGDTGSDCVGTAIRQKALSVHQFELMPQPAANRLPDNPWPNWAFILRTSSSQEEGCARDYSIMTKRLSGENGQLKKLHAVRLQWIKDPANGAMKMSEIPGSEFEMECDFLLLAMGFTGPVKKGMLEELGVALDARGNVAADSHKMTSVPGVFTAGDMTRGQSLVVWAIQEGRAAAEGVHHYLTAKSIKKS